MNCHDLKSKMPDLLFDSELMIAEESALPQSMSGSVTESAASEAIRQHLAGCAECRGELEELRSTISLLDAWRAPEPNPYFLTRLNARLDEEREAAPVGWPLSWYEKLRARMLYGSRHTLRPVAAMALTVVVLLGGGAYLGLNQWDQPVQPAQAAVVRDLQTLNNNAQLLDQLEALSSQNGD